MATNYTYPQLMGMVPQEFLKVMSDFGITAAATDTKEEVVSRIIAEQAKRNNAEMAAMPDWLRGAQQPTPQPRVQQYEQQPRQPEQQRPPQPQVRRPLPRAAEALIKALPDGIEERVREFLSGIEADEALLYAAIAYDAIRDRNFVTKEQFEQALKAERTNMLRLVLAVMGVKDTPDTADDVELMRRIREQLAAEEARKPVKTEGKGGGLFDWLNQPAFGGKKK